MGENKSGGCTRNINSKGAMNVVYGAFSFTQAQGKTT